MSHRVITTFLRHDRKVNSYKIALRRALPHPRRAFGTYGASPDVAEALHADVAMRFTDAPASADAIARSVADLTKSIAALRDSGQF